MSFTWGGRPRQNHTRPPEDLVTYFQQEPLNIAQSTTQISLCKVIFFLDHEILTLDPSKTEAQVYSRGIQITRPETAPNQLKTH